MFSAVSLKIFCFLFFFFFLVLSHFMFFHFVENSFSSKIIVRYNFIHSVSLLFWDWLFYVALRLFTLMLCSSHKTHSALLFLACLHQVPGHIVCCLQIFLLAQAYFGWWHSCQMGKSQTSWKLNGDCLVYNWKMHKIIISLSLSKYLRFLKGIFIYKFWCKCKNRDYIFTLNSNSLIILQRLVHLTGIHGN